MKNQGTRLLLILLIVAAATISSVKWGVRYGLDLAGGGSLTYRVEVEPGIDIKERIPKIVEVLDSRLNSAGLGGIDISPTEQNEIVIDVPGRTREQLEPIKDLIKRNGKLEFRIVAPESVSRELLQKREEMGRLFSLKDVNREIEYPKPWYAIYEPSERAIQEAEAEGRGRPPSTVVLVPEAPYEARLQELQESPNPDAEAIRALQLEISHVESAELFRGEDLADTRVQRGQVEIVVYFEMRTERKIDFTDFTTRNVKKQMAIILDGTVDSAPIIQSTLPGNGVINGGGGGGFSEEEARLLSIVLASGATGAKLELDRVEVLGPSLGADAIDTGKLSVIIGFLLVLVTMVWLYRLPGVVANVALLLNVVVLIGALAFFRAALTLAGIAGVVLTLGMAVDANILIFERLKEERLRGKSLLEALAAGYDRALVAIVDANVTTVLTAVVLIWLGSGTVRGFGVTLTIGILASMFTAIFVTRTIFEWMLSSGLVKDLRFGATRKVPEYNYMKWRRFFTGPSLIVMVIGLAFFAWRSEEDSKDLEFIGGQQAIIQLVPAISPTEARELARGEPGSDSFYEDAAPLRLDPVGLTDVPPDHSNRWLIKTKATDQAAGDKFLDHLVQRFGDRLAPQAFADFELPVERSGRSKATGNLRLLSDGATAEGLRAALSDVRKSPEGPASFSDVTVEAVPDSPKQFAVSLTPATPELTFVTDQILQAVQAMDPPVYLSDPMPSVSFLNPQRAEQLWRTALEAVLVAMLLQVLYIRLRFADYKHGFAAVCALIHDVTIAIAFVSFFDHFGLVHAKINLVLIAAFLTLIGYSMNDTIVVFDRIRENMGRSKVVKSELVNTALNQTLRRSIRTSVTTWLVVLVQFVLNWGKGSVLEGFAFVMVVGVVSGTYSSIFIAAPLLLFLPVFWRRFARRPKLAVVQVVASVVGGLVAVTAKGHGGQMIIGSLFALNIPMHFLFHFIPWLGHENPDDFLEAEINAESKDRPLAAPGI